MTEWPLELFEAVLLQLDLQTLLLSQRVSRSWAWRIRHSGPIQRALFFAPAATTDHDVVANPLLAEHFPLWFPQRNRTNERKCFDNRKLDFFLATRKETHLRPEASWRRMLVVQPALHSLAWIERHRSSKFPATELCYWVFHFAEAEGIRMDALYDLVVSKQKNAGFYFRIFWSWNRLIYKTSPDPPMQDVSKWRSLLGRAFEQFGVVLDTWDTDKTDHELTWNSVVEKYQLPATERNRRRLMESGSLESQVWVDPAEMTGSVGWSPLSDEDDVDL